MKFYKAKSDSSEIASAKMASRPILSRPRTRIYDANYNIGHNYYKSALDSIDRKYSGRPLSPPRNNFLPRDLEERHERAFFDEDLSSARKRAEKHISEPSLFDSRGGRIAARTLDFLEDDLDDETSSTLKRIRASKKITAADDVGLNSAVTSITSRRLVDRSEKILDSVGINDSSRRALDDDVTFKRRSLKVSYEDDGGDMTKWSRLTREDGGDSSAAIRAKQSRERIQDLEEEMNALAEKQATRERRAARLKALVAESAEETEAAQSAIQAVSVRARREQQTVEY